MKPSSTYTALVLGAQVVDPKWLVNANPTLESWEAFVTAANEAIPASPPRSDGFVICPDLVFDDGYSQRYIIHYCPCCADLAEIRFRPYSSASPQPTPEDYYYSPPLQTAPTDDVSSSSHITFSSSPAFSETRVLMAAPCAGGEPVKQQDGRYGCPVCGKSFGRRDDAKRHMSCTKMRISCKYCKKIASGRPDGHRRHLEMNKKCMQDWEAGVKAGRFTVRTVEDAFY